MLHPARECHRDLQGKVAADSTGLAKCATAEG